MDKNCELHELLGLCWGKPDREAIWKCKKCGAGMSLITYPDYAADPRLVLREMMLKCKDWDGFVDRIGVRIGGQAYFHHAFILDTNGLCRDQAIVWLKRDERTD